MRNLTMKMLAVLAGIFGALILLELGLIIFHPLPAKERIRWIPDGHIRGRYQPNQEFQTGPGHNPAYLLREKQYTNQINRYGFRGPDYSLKPDPGTVRFLALGGLSTFNYHDPEEATWPQRLAQKLEGHFQIPTELQHIRL